MPGGGAKDTRTFQRDARQALGENVPAVVGPGTNPGPSPVTATMNGTATNVAGVASASPPHSHQPQNYQYIQTNSPSPHLSHHPRSSLNNNTSAIYSPHYYPNGSPQSAHYSPQHHYQNYPNQSPSQYQYHYGASPSPSRPPLSKSPYAQNPYTNPNAGSSSRLPTFSDDYNFKFDKDLTKKYTSKRSQPGRFFIPGRKFGQVAFPDVDLNILPESKIKFRKFFLPPLDFLAQFKAGFDFDLKNTALRLRCSCKDSIVGSRLSLNGTEIALSKVFSFDRTGVKFEAAYDFRQSSTRFGFSVKPFQGITATSFPQGFEFRKKIPVHENFKVQLIGDMIFPESGYSRGSNGMSFGKGPLTTNFREANLYFSLHPTDVEE